MDYPFFKVYWAFYDEESIFSWIDSLEISLKLSKYTSLNTSEEYTRPVYQSKTGRTIGLKQFQMNFDPEQLYSLILSTSHVTSLIHLQATRSLL